MRRLVFVSIVLVLLGSLSLVVLGNPGAPAQPRRTSRRPAAVSSSVSGDGPAPDAAARPEARRFLAAFLAFEAGDQTPRARRALRATSGRRLAGQILTAPRTSAGARGPVVVGHLHVLHLHRLSGHTGLLLASGTAVQPEGPEPFSFLFARRRGRWLAIAPAE